MEITSRKEAKQKGLKHYFNGVPCIRGHVDRRLVVGAACLTCARERARSARLADVDKYRESVRKYYNSKKGKAQHLLKGAKRRASDYNIPFNLTVDHVKKLLEPGICSVSGLPLYMKDGSAIKGTGPFSPSLDKIYPTKGYIIGNVRIVAHIVNVSMSNWGEYYMRKMAKAIVEKRVPRFYFHPYWVQKRRYDRTRNYVPM